MRKTIMAISVVALTANLYAFDPDATLKTSGTVGEYTKTEFSITQKFGDYYRSPRAKYVHSFASNGKEAVSKELTSRDSVVDSISYSYNTSGKLVSQICTDADGKVQWKITYAYDGSGNKIDESEYNASDILMNRSIWKYSGKQTEESLYNSEGALLGKTITKADEMGRKGEVSQYNDDGRLEIKQIYTYNDAGKLSEVAYLNATGGQIKRIVYRFDASYSVTEKQTYDAENKLSIREIYKYDSNGNISKATTYSVAEKFGGTVNELVGINEYSYKYGAGTATLKTVGESSTEDTTTTVDTAVESISDAK